MSNYETPVLTNKGFEILTAKNSGNAEGNPLRLTKMAIGTGMLPLNQRPEELPDLICKLKDINIIEFEITGLGLSNVTGEINNIEITEESPIFEVGVYAEDPVTLEDVLYTYVYTRSTPIILCPPKTTIYIGEFTAKTIISRDANVEVNIIKPERAINISYDNSKSGLFANTVQTAIDEVVDRLGKATHLYLLDIPIHHGINAYPDVLVVEFGYGCGVGPCGEGPCGGTSGKKLRSTVEYLDRSQIMISVEKEYGKVQNLIRLSQTEYIVAFVDCTLSLFVMLMTGDGGETGSGGNVFETLDSLVYFNPNYPAIGTAKEALDNVLTALSLNRL